MELGICKFFFSCDICTKIMKPSGERVPVVFPYCGNTVCLSCVKELQMSREPACPFCESTTEIDKCSESFVTNKLLVQQLEKVCQCEAHFVAVTCTKCTKSFCGECQVNHEIERDMQRERMLKHKSELNRDIDKLRDELKRLASEEYEFVKKNTKYEVKNGEHWLPKSASIINGLEQAVGDVEPNGGEKLQSQVPAYVMTVLLRKLDVETVDTDVFCVTQ